MKYSRHSIITVDHVKEHLSDRSYKTDVIYKLVVVQVVEFSVSNHVNLLVYHELSSKLYCKRVRILSIGRVLVVCYILYVV